MSRRRILMAGMVLSVLLISVLPLAGDPRDLPPVPSRDQWVYDFGQGWFTAHVEGQANLLLLKKFPQALEDEVKFGIGGFEVMQTVPGKPPVIARGQAKVQFVIHFRVAADHIVLMTEDGKTQLVVRLADKTFDGNGFAGTLGRDQNGDYVLVLIKWPPGDPLMGG